MRIAFLSSEFVTEPYFSGGLANYICRIAGALTRQGHEVHVATRSLRDETIVHQGITVHRINSSLPYKVLRTAFLKRARAARHADIILQWMDFSVRAHRVLEKLDRERGLDVVQISNCLGVGCVPALFMRVPHVLRLSSYSPAWNASLERQGLSWDWFELVERQQLARSRYLFAPSHALKRLVEAEVPTARVRVIRSPFFIETQELNDDAYQRHCAGKKYLLYFGQLSVRKGVRLLADALPRLLAERPEAHAVLVGDIRVNAEFYRSEKQYLLERCAPFRDRVTILDALRHDRLYPIVMNAHLVVLPSLMDNLPNALIEAMGLGAPVLASVAGSSDELIEDGVNGFLLRELSPAALAERILEVWGRDDLAAIGERAAETTCELSPDDLARQHVALYEEAIRGWRR